MEDTLTCKGCNLVLSRGNRTMYGSGTSTLMVSSSQAVATEMGTITTAHPPFVECRGALATLVSVCPSIVNTRPLLPVTKTVTGTGIERALASGWYTLTATSTLATQARRGSASVAHIAKCRPFCMLVGTASGSNGPLGQLERWTLASARLSSRSAPGGGIPARTLRPPLSREPGIAAVVAAPSLVERLSTVVRGRTAYSSDDFTSLHCGTTLALTPCCVSRSTFSPQTSTYAP